ncbi:ribulose-phosphate 3-epimerase [Sulfobacillus acidophilus TPY]|uniref:Ribulose-phosphate 3-epimerase n=1 Tax=Sulfobacillus acidophilus (strain ATCC 700253 / DSM 10332 / NAL) TaxID=679936 RepID=G8TW43_SULAD|nr:ribulose-phosphate 3-epimerase [Sulfobacillus acidophilus TPY]AEW05970.1 ribulose-phosphate 3-epimerase [Sulfobacillus acidophilus DSM 10332]
MAPVRIAPSILSADFTRLADAIGTVSSAADLLHVDVMDGRFVPNITLGPLIVEAVRRTTDLPIDVHMMIVEPDRYVADFRKAGADMISVHVEACPHLQRTIEQIRETGALAGVAINPATPVEMLIDILPDVDYVLVMSVNPGFGGQTFWPRAVDKIRRLAALRGERERPLIEVDGGINQATAASVIEAGADILVAGSFVFGAENPSAQIEILRQAVAPL